MEITGDEFKAEVTRWRHKNGTEIISMRSQRLVETLDHANPQFYPEVFVVLVAMLICQMGAKIKTPISPWTKN